MIPTSTVKIGALITTSLVALALVGGSTYSIDQSALGVLLRNKAAIAVVKPGLHFKVPIIDTVEVLSMQEFTRVYEQVWAYSADQQPASMTISVTYNLIAEDTEYTYSKYKTRESAVARILDRKTPDQVKTVFGQYSAVKAITERGQMVNAIYNSLSNSIDRSIKVVSVQIENIDFSDAYEQAVEDRMLEEVGVEKIKQNKKKEVVLAAIKIIQADANAAARVAEATATAESITLVGNAEATAIKARGDALRENPDIIGLVQAENWNGALPTTMLPNTTVPFMNMNR